MTNRQKKAMAFTGALLLVCGLGLWFVNTESLSFPYQDEAIVLAQGETVDIDIEGNCLPNLSIRYRTSFLGR